ncbi:MAG: hypothetical protein ACLFVS_05355 [Candidatus Acetothermia bacterium]
MLQGLDELETGETDNVLEAVTLYGFRFRHTFPNGLNLRYNVPTFDDKNTSISGYSDFSQKFQVSSPFYLGYRAPDRIQLTNYIASLEEPPYFGWGRSRLKMIAPVSEQLELNTDMVLTPEDPVVELTIGAEIIW